MVMGWHPGNYALPDLFYGFLHSHIIAVNSERQHVNSKTKKCRIGQSLSVVNG
jgi:hypothetical protein